VALVRSARRRLRAPAAQRDLGERVLGEILGRVILGRLMSHRSALGLRDELEGRWFVPRDRPGARVLQVRAGDLLLAELSDFDGDGRADVALLIEP
jgi:hypothetical protein